MQYFWIFLVYVLLPVDDALHLPKYLHSCRRTDPDLKNCALKAAANVIANIHNGDKKYGVPNLTPLTLPIVEVNGGNNLILKFNNLDVIGLGNAVVNDIEILEDGMNLKIIFDNLQLIGTYEAKGNLLILPIEGSGASNITVVNVNATYNIKFETAEANKIVHKKITQTDFTFDLSRAYFRFENLFNGDPKLGEHVNMFMNENWSDVIGDLKPSVNRIVSEILDTIVGNYFKNVSGDELFPE